MKTKKMKAWADMGSHGKIFVFISGPVAVKYPGLMCIYEKKVTPGLVPITITYD